MGKIAQVDMKSYIDQGFTSIRESITHLENIINDKFEASNQIRIKDSEVLNERLSHMNQFREEAISDKSTFVRKENLEMQLKNVAASVDSRLEALETKQTFLNGKNAGMLMVVGIVVFVVQFIVSYLDKILGILK